VDGQPDSNKAFIAKVIANEIRLQKPPHFIWAR